MYMYIKFKNCNKRFGCWCRVDITTPNPSPPTNFNTRENSHLYPHPIKEGFPHPNQTDSYWYPQMQILLPSLSGWLKRKNKRKKSGLSANKKNEFCIASFWMPHIRLSILVVSIIHLFFKIYSSWRLYFLIDPICNR